MKRIDRINTMLAILKMAQKVQEQRLDCSGDDAWAHGNSLINYMKVPFTF